MAGKGGRRVERRNRWSEGMGLVGALCRAVGKEGGGGTGGDPAAPKHALHTTPKLYSTAYKATACLPQPAN